MVLKVVPSGLAVFSSANTSAGETISSAGSADSATMFSAAVEAIGPIGAAYLAAYGPAQINNLTSTLQVGAVHALIGGATHATDSSFIAADNA